MKGDQQSVHQCLVCSQPSCPLSPFNARLDELAGNFDRVYLNAQKLADEGVNTFIYVDGSWVCGIDRLVQLADLWFWIQLDTETQKTRAFQRYSARTDRLVTDQGVAEMFERSWPIVELAANEQRLM